MLENSSKCAGLGYHSATWPSGEVTKKQHAGAETFSGHRQALMKFFWELSCRRCRLGSPFFNTSTLSDAKSYMWVYMWIMNYESGLTQKFSVNKMILGLSSPISFLSNVKPGCFFSNFHAPKSGFVIQRVGQRDGNSFFLQPQLGSQDGGGFVQQSVGLGPGTLDSDWNPRKWKGLFF